MSVARPLGRDFFARSVHAVAPELIGAVLMVDGADGPSGGVIVEVEAYHHTDPAAHSFRGLTARNAAMFGPPGHAYVYRSYGIHWCLNFVCEEEGSASAVLIRALEPTMGLAAMAMRRGLAQGIAPLSAHARESLHPGPGRSSAGSGSPPWPGRAAESCPVPFTLAERRQFCSGPGKLCEALAITGVHDRLALDAPPFTVLPRPAPVAVASGPRIGITKAVDLPWRYGLKGSPFLSRAFRE